MPITALAKIEFAKIPRAPLSAFVNLVSARKSRSAKVTIFVQKIMFCRMNMFDLQSTDLQLSSARDLLLRQLLQTCKSA